MSRSSRTETAYSPELDDVIRESALGTLGERAHAVPQYFPRYLSSWCMSNRKRYFDLVLSLFGLVGSFPLMLLITLIIKLTSDGPALFQQERVGLHQETFTILKFRTMENHLTLQDPGPTVTRHSDPRMTKIGSVLRRLKLDELPQLINVARGDMSFVGPRPKIAQHENLCMLCRPGITGAATVEFSQEEELLLGVPENLVERYVVTVLNPEKCKLDVEYMETATFRSDLKILLRTVFKLRNRRRRNLSRQCAHIVATTPMTKQVPLQTMCPKQVTWLTKMFGGRPR